MENGWPRCTLDDCDYITIPGSQETLPFQRGFPAILLPGFIADLNAFVEPLLNARGYSDEGTYTANNSVPSSNHNGATAFDFNWDDHPMGPDAVAGDCNAGWCGSILIPGNEVPAVLDLLAWWEGMIWWGAQWNSPKDSMHFQVGYNTFGAANAARVQNFIDRKIRADGFSTYKRGGTARGGGVTPPVAVPATTGLTAQVLSDIMGARVSIDRYQQLLPPLLLAFDYAECNTIDRRAGALGQLGAESGGFEWQTELASGAEYEGRCSDLGNCFPGDGERYKGRDFIQVTGRKHYSDLSIWAHGLGIVPTPTFFVDNPEELADDHYAFLGFAWYWKVERPQLNSLADARDIMAMTYAVNGGYNGLDARKAYYQRALDANAELLDPTPTDEWDALMADETEYPSGSIYRTSNDPGIKLRQFVQNLDAMSYNATVDAAAIRGETWALDLVVAVGQGAAVGSFQLYAPTLPDTWARQHAVDVLNYAEAVNSTALSAYLASKQGASA